MSIDWNAAPEGATHYSKRFGEFYKAEDGFLLNYQNEQMQWIVLKEWHVDILNCEHLAMIERPESTEPKQLTQAVFDGLPSEYRWAAVDNRGSAYAFTAKPKPFKSDFRDWDFNNVVTISLGGDYNTTDWENSLIEREESITDVARSIEAARVEERDAVNNPEHYKTGGIECIDAMQAMLSDEEFIGYLRGNIFKYQWRYKHKNGVEDLRKADWYAQRLVELEAENAART
jgi:hypothetical protein